MPYKNPKIFIKNITFLNIHKTKDQDSKSAKLG